MSTPRIAVVLAARNPHRGRLGEVLAGLARQTLPAAQWEFCLVDNGSSPALQAAEFSTLAGARVVVEPRPGLLWARLRGLASTSATYVVFIDDDTIPGAEFLTEAVAFMDTHPRAGTAGGRITGRFETSLPDWLEDAQWCLALRDSGDQPLEWSLGAGPFPFWTPIGAGLLTRRAALEPGYVGHVAAHWQAIQENSWVGQGVGGVEDKDLVLHCLRAGWSTGYAPRMQLTHLIPTSRLDRSYIERLVPNLERIWMRTLHAHSLDLFRPIHPATLWLRQARAWIGMRAWHSPAARIKWLSACGRFRGLADNFSRHTRYPEPSRQ